MLEKNKKKILILGNGLIGKDLLFFLSHNFDVISSSRNSETELVFDLVNQEEYGKVPYDIDILIFAIGIGSLETCEKNKIFTYKINVYLTIKFINFYRNLNPKVKIILFSTSQVFNGSKFDLADECKIDPISNYGHHKLIIENYFKDNSNISILRLTKVIDKFYGLFNNIVSKLSSNSEIQFFDNYYLAPISTYYIANIIEKLIKNWEPGIYNLSSDAQISYFDLAIRLKTINKIDNLKISPIKADAKSIFMKKLPQNVILNMDKSLKCFNIGNEHFELLMENYKNFIRGKI